MYRIISMQGDELGMVDEVLYIKVTESGSFAPCAMEEAVGVAVNSEAYNLLGHEDIEGAETVIVSRYDGASLVASEQKVLDNMLISMLEG